MLQTTIATPKPKARTSSQVTGAPQWTKALAIAWPAVALFLGRFTDTDVPWWDAFPTAASILGQWLLGRKYVENWPVWIVVDVVAAALFAYKGLWLTTILYLVFVAMALVGWRGWLARAAGGEPTR